MKRRQLRLSTRLAAAFAFALLLAVGSSYVGYHGLRSMKWDIDQIAGDNALYANSQHIKTLMLQHRRYEKDIFLNIGDREKQVQKYIPSLAAKSDEIRTAIQHIAATVQTDGRFDAELQHKAAALPDLYEQYYTGVREVATRATNEADFTPQAANKAMSPHKEAIHHLESYIDEVADAVTAAFGQRVQQAQVLASRSNKLLLAAAVAVVILGAFLATYITRSITRPLNRIISSLSEGAEQVSGAAAQVSSASQQLAAGASEQASSLEETSSSLEEMAAMSRTNAGNATDADKLSSQARDAAEAGDQTMTRLNSAMVGINESSGQISKIIKVIEEIAFQTNLLALNAAVEAARAGEHGRGFAVVADEVRNLAQRCAQAARETTALIEDSVNRAREGAGVADEVGQVLGAIVGDVTKVSDLIKDISRASQEQTLGVDQVNSAIAQIDKVTQLNAANAEESASAAEELNAQARTVTTIVAELSGLVNGRRHEAPTQPSAPSPQVSKRPTAAQPIVRAAAPRADRKPPERTAAPATAATGSSGANATDCDLSNF